MKNRFALAVGTAPSFVIGAALVQSGPMMNDSSGGGGAREGCPSGCRGRETNQLLAHVTS